GNILAVIGHNGAGKSTLIKSILGLLPGNSGTLTIKDKGKGKSEILLPEQHMAFCPETGAVFADITVENYVKLWCRLKQNDANYYRKDGSHIIDRLNITPLFSKLGRELSKGQRRRVQTAVGFLCNPRFFLFDEPFDGLDVQKTRELTDLIRDYSKDIAFMVSSHRMDVVERLADKVIVLYRGEVLAAGSTEEVSKALCGRSALISNLSDHQRMLELLGVHFPAALVNRMGDDIVLSGPDLDLKKLLSFIKKHDANGAFLRETTPRLADAMNFHLQNINE
ncbi:MAG: ABC transporter ATP-binding protein, partial [Candidatus Dadabacteria bacterium]